MTDWLEKEAFSLKRRDDDIWEIRLSSDTFKHQDLYRLRIHWPGGEGDRIPTYARRVVQDTSTMIVTAQVWFPAAYYQWQCPDFRRPDESPLVYEAHIGMAQEEEKIGSFQEFTANVLPRIVESG